jgi:glutathione peroxidase
MKALIILLAVGLGSYYTSIYSQHYITLNGDQVYMSQYQGKKMLLVNMASESPYAATQIPQMEQLYQAYKDSLIVIGFPSNDFGNEPRSNNDIKLLMENTYHSTFPVSQQVGVRDSTISLHPIYQWLQHQDLNGIMNVKVKRDFQKYLIDNDGKIIGVFSAKIDPMDSIIINAITQ